jgi:hypothetical protein
VDIDSCVAVADNANMEVQGRVENGVVVIVGGTPLPEGADVSVVYPAPNRYQPAAKK